MSKSKVDPDRKSKRVTTKQTKKAKVMSQNQNVRQRPIWGAQETLEITGLEFEKIYNFIGGAAEASEALHSVLTRNILGGKIKFEFERQDESGQFTPLNEEESKPYQEQVDKAIEQAKAAQQNPKPQPQMEIVE
jgi:hypothetical protein